MIDCVVRILFLDKKRPELYTLHYGEEGVYYDYSPAYEFDDNLISNTPVLVRSSTSGICKEKFDKIEFWVAFQHRKFLPLFYLLKLFLTGISILGGVFAFMLLVTLVANLLEIFSLWIYLIGVVSLLGLFLSILAIMAVPISWILKYWSVIRSDRAKNSNS